MISSKGEFRNGIKNAKLACLLPISMNSGVQKWMALLLSKKLCQFTCYWRTVVSSNHMTTVICKNNKLRDQLVSPTKKRERERESTTWKPWALPAMAASVAYAPSARVPAR